MSSSYNQSPRRGRGTNQMPIRTELIKRYGQHHEGELSVAPPPPPNINPANRERNVPGSYTDYQANSRTYGTERHQSSSMSQGEMRNRGRARTPPAPPPPGFDDHRRPSEIPKARGGEMRMRGSNTNMTPGGKGDYHRESHGLNDNISGTSSSNMSRKNPHGYEDGFKSNNREQRRYSPGRNHHSTVQVPPPLPSTSYATVNSNDAPGYLRSHTSPQNNFQGPRSAAVTTYQGMSHNHSRDTDKEVRKKPTRRETEKDYQKKHYKNESDQFNVELSTNKIRKSREGNLNSSSNAKHLRSGSYDRSRSPINSRRNEYNRSNEREGFTNVQNDTDDTRLSPTDLDRRHPLISQREAFHRQQEKRSNIDGEYRKAEVRDKEEYIEPNYVEKVRLKGELIKNHSNTRRSSLDIPKKSNNINSTNEHVERHSSNYIECSSGQRNDKVHHERKSRSPKYDRHNSYEENRDTSLHKPEQNSYKRNSSSSVRPFKNEEENCQFKGTAHQNANKVHKEKPSNITCNENKNQHDTISNMGSSDHVTSRKRKSSGIEAENSPITNKGKHQPGVQPKGKKSTTSPTRDRRRHKGKRSIDSKDNNSSKDSDVESASSETKRISALARLGPKVTLNERLSKLPDPKDDLQEFSKNYSEGMKSKIDECKREETHPSSMGNEITQKKDISLNIENMKDAATTSSGMQITIRKGPDDQTERVVNSDNTNLHWSRVNFGDKKYIKLQCPHCETVCVTFNEYSSHFQKEAHIKSIRKVKMRLQHALQILRKMQRDNQKKLDSGSRDNKDDGGKKNEKSGYCKTCKLIFKHQSKVEHEETDFHNKIMMFLYPKCNFCNVPKFFSPMAYEKHVATLGHIKKRSKLEDMETEEVKSQNKIADEKMEEMEICSNPIFGEFDPDEFEVLDEVGEEDDNHVETRQCNELGTCSNSKHDSLILNENSKPCSEQDETVSEKTKQAGNNENLEKLDTSDMKRIQQTCKVEIKEEEKAESPLKSSVTAEVENETDTINNCDVLIGEKYVRIVEMLYCDLCHKYLPKIEHDKDIQCLLRDHCLTTGHQDAYNKHENEKELLNEKSKHSTEIQNKQQSMKTLPYSADEDQLDFEAEDSISAADTSSMIDDDSIAG